MRQLTIACGLVAALSACSGPFGGNDQTIMILSYPSGATCEVTRAGAAIARVATTPMSVEIPTGTDPLEVACTAPGLRTASHSVTSAAPPGSLGRHVLGGDAGRRVDATLLTEFRYPGTIMVMIDADAPLPPRMPLAH